jgi:hypothetical protein
LVEGRSGVTKIADTRKAEGKEIHVKKSVKREIKGKRPERKIRGKMKKENKEWRTNACVKRRVSTQDEGMRHHPTVGPQPPSRPLMCWKPLGSAVMKQSRATIGGSWTDH